MALLHRKDTILKSSAMIVSMLPVFNQQHLSFCIPEQLHNSNIGLNLSPLFLTLTAKSIKKCVFT